MSDFITLSCPVCTGQLQITEDLERFACAYCGTEHIVRRTPGTVSLQPLVQGIEKVQKGVDRTAYELAISRLEREIAAIDKQISKTQAERDRLGDAASDALRIIASGAVIFAAALGMLFLFSGDGGGPIVMLVVGLAIVARGATWLLKHRRNLAKAIAQETQLRSQRKSLQDQYAHQHQIASG
jgi:Fe2+ transport system protein B